jgi:hypothetical protein
MIQSKEIFGILSFLVSLSGIFLSDAIAEDKGYRYEQLSEEDMEIVQMLEILETYDVLINMDLLENINIGERNENRKDGGKEILQGGGR